MDELTEDHAENISVVSADLARELYEALKRASEKIDGEFSPDGEHREWYERPLARYEREVGG